ncbi:hypothetical protein pqer_cds_610 [Pandoravirus quercus]|uniref:Uncharacterized protein n=2 Tax=Pandoravirus TaxID=2060084 RepID=A0A2U7U9G0_9VIRU|nr:hypothetical protein pqer_cds_610 [Pandoravirus quercus]AVK75032.1 hypothetical protein pqer_cds_610 [Pandoravirus quercus]QBZ81269.1 hypothetical protein pclt_cds_682 [Pandoravirus celtis]
MRIIHYIQINNNDLRNSPTHPKIEATAEERYTFAACLRASLDGVESEAILDGEFEPERLPEAIDTFKRLFNKIEDWKEYARRESRPGTFAGTVTIILSDKRASEITLHRRLAHVRFPGVPIHCLLAE